MASHVVMSAEMKPARARSGSGTPARLPHPALLIPMTVVAVFACSLNAVAAGANTLRSGGIGYLCCTLVLLCCSLSFLTRARFAGGALRIRWALTALGALAASIAFVPCFTQGVLNTRPYRVFETACFNSSEALYMLAAVLFFAGVSRSILIADMLQALLFILLRFHLVYSPAGYEQFTADHLIVAQFMALFLFLAALVGCLGAASSAEVKFLRTLTWFFGIRLVAYFLSNQVSYTWQHYGFSSQWDTAGTVLFAGFALATLYTSPSKTGAGAASLTPDPEPRVRSLTVSSLMPSFLALVNVLLGLFLLRISATLAALAISASLVCYVVRTVLLQAEALQDKAQLQTRNQQLEGLAVLDPLTGIGNRRSLAQVYSRLQATGGGQGLSLLLMDIDRFKQANDSHGHLHGDQVLIALAQTLKDLAAGVPGSHCVRLGGDEFALLLPGVAPQAASNVAEVLRAVLSAHSFSAGTGNVTLSVGIASLRAGQELPLETLVNQADQALYRAKRLGRDRVEVQPAWQAEAADQLSAAGARLQWQSLN